MNTLPTAAREPQASSAHVHAQAVREAAAAMAATRHAQRGLPTFGDDADARMLATLASLRASDLALTRSVLREAGATVGREVYARRCFEDSPAGAIAILSTTLLASGWGSLQVASWFHRAGELGFTPDEAASRIDADVVACYLSGAIEAYLAEAFNCRAEVEARGASFVARLHEGRDVNAARSR